MVKACSVPGCPTGRYKDRTNRHALGLRQLALFRAPKCNDRLCEWMRVLDCSLDVKKFVCELHFNEEDIKKYDKTLLRTGEVHQIPRIVWHLTHDATPIPRTQDGSSIGYADEALLETTQINPTDGECEDENVSNDNTVLSAVSPTSPTAKSASINDADFESDAFTMDVLRAELSTASLPESWAWSQQSSKTVFTHLDPGSLCPRLHLEVTSDLSLQIRTNTGVVIPLKEIVTSTADIWGYFDTFQKISICSGTGIGSKSHHRSCPGLLDIDEIYKRTPRHPRCTFCRQLRIGLQKKRQQRHDSARQKYQRTKLMAKLIQKFLRLQQWALAASSDDISDH